MKEITEKEFKQIAEYIKVNYGINLFQKKSLIVGRLQNYLESNQFQSFSEYFDYVVMDKSGGAITTLLNKLTTNHTFFMRESDHFDYFKSVVLPFLAMKESVKKDLRVWSAGCSTGEEPYTLAMIMADYFGFDKGAWDTKILATDISTKVLETAMNGVYYYENLANVSESWKRSYFKKLDTERCEVTERIKNEVVFRKFNLMEKDFPFKRKFHVIFCRNVMIYFDNETKKELIRKYYEFTEPGGYLFIGHSESINREDTKYKYILPAIYRKDIV